MHGILTTRFHAVTAHHTTTHINIVFLNIDASRFAVSCTQAAAVTFFQIEDRSMQRLPADEAE